MRLLGGDVRAFRIFDHRADIEGGFFAAAGDLDCLFHRHAPGVIELRVGELLGQQVLFRQTSEGVGGGEAGDRNRRIHRGFHCCAGKIGGAGVAALLAQIHRDAQPLVAVVFNGFHFAVTHANGLAKAFRDVDLSGRGAAGAGVIEHLLRQVAQRIWGETETLSGHERRGWFERKVYLIAFL